MPNKEILALSDSNVKKNTDSYLSELTKNLEISLKYLNDFYLFIYETWSNFLYLNRKVNEELDNYGDDDDLESLAMEELKKL